MHAVVDRDHEPFGIDLHAADQQALLHALRHATDTCPPPHRTSGWRYHLDNAPFPWGDGLTAWAMLAHLRPRRVVEIGSGWSTRLLLDARDRLLPDLDLTVVDPHSSFSDACGARVLRAPVQDVDIGLFEALTPGDLCFADSSHVAKAGSDVNHLWFEIVPRLAPGVVVHVHDVHWPFEYPDAWIRQGRAWTEAYVVHALLLGGALVEIMFWGSYLHHHGVALFDGAEHNVGASLYLVRRET
jgi:hypothetical protein